MPRGKEVDLHVDNYAPYLHDHGDVALHKGTRESMVCQEVYLDESENGFEKKMKIRRSEQYFRFELDTTKLVISRTTRIDITDSLTPLRFMRGTYDMQKKCKVNKES